MRLTLILSTLFTSIPFLTITPRAACPDGYMLYSKGTIRIQDRTKVQGGSIRGEDTVTVGMYAQVKGNLSGKTAVLLDGANIQGSITTSGILTRSNSAVVSGTITQNTVLAPCNITEEPAISFGTVDKTVPWDSLNTLLPGSYRDLLVHSRGTVSLQPGNYYFRNITLEPDAKIFIQSGGEMAIHVQNQIFLDDRIQMVPKGQGGLPTVRIYSNQTVPFQIGHDCKLFGAFISPESELQISDRTTIQGTVISKKVTIGFDVVISNSLDSDGDGVPDLVELLLGTDPTSAASKPSLGKPSQWFIPAADENTILYNYSGFNDYTKRTGVLVSIPGGSLSSSLAPIVQIKEPTDPSVPAMTIPSSWRVKGKVFEVQAQMQQNRKILFGFPLPDSSLPSLKENKLVLLHYVAPTWRYVPVEYVSNGIAYSYVNSFSPFVLLENTDTNSVIYVNCETRFTGGDGKSWATAYADLSDALADAKISKKEVWVAGEQPNGRRLTYVLISNTVPDVAYEVFEGVRVYGGFWGHTGGSRPPNTLRSQRNLAFKPIISTETYKPDSITYAGLKWANRVFKLDEGAVLDGVETYTSLATFPANGRGVFVNNNQATVANVHFSGARGTNGNGGAVYVQGNSGHLDVVNCDFNDNLANGFNGGALAAENGAQVHITGGSLWYNEGIKGGAFYFDNASAVIEGAHFIHNFSQEGGVIYSKKSRIEIRNSLLDSNWSTRLSGGAIYVDSLSKFFLTSTSLVANSAETNGGGISNFSKDSVGISTSQFITNWAGNGGGGGIFNYATLPIIDRCIFSRNFAGSGGGIYNNHHASPLIQNSVLTGNSAQSDAFGGGAISNIDSSSPIVRNCTIYDNTTIPSSALGGGIYSFLSSTPLIENTIIWGNHAYENPEIGGQHGNSSFRNSLVKGFNLLRFGVDTGSGLVPPIDLGGNLGQDTIADNPSFKNPQHPSGIDGLFMTSDDGLMLLSNSKAINAGNLTNAPRVDILGAQRPIGSGVDIGAYELDNRIPVVVITSPSKTRDTTVSRSPLTVFYTVDGSSRSKDVALIEGRNRIIIDTVYSNGSRGVDTVYAILNTQGPPIQITFPGRDTIVDTSFLTVRYTANGLPTTKPTTLTPGYNFVTVSSYDSLGNLSTATRIIGLFSSGSHLTANAVGNDTVFTYQLVKLEGKSSQGPTGTSLKYAWRQIQGAPLTLANPTEHSMSFSTRGEDRVAFELRVSDAEGLFPVSLDTVVLNVIEPSNELEFAEALEAAKNNREGSFSINIEPTGTASLYTQDNSIQLQGTLMGTSDPLGIIRWICNSRTGTFQPSDQNWISPAISLDPGDNWITLIYSEGSQVATDRILISRGDVDMSGFDLTPNVFWADSAMNFKLIVNANDPAISNMHLIRITNQENDLGELVDDGTGGDDFASDRRYTLQFNLTPKSDSIYWFRIKANKSGVNSYSPLYTFRPRLNFQPAFASTILDVNGRADSLFNSLRVANDKLASLDSLVNWLTTQNSIASVGISADSNGAFWKFKSGVRSILSENNQGTLALGTEVRTKGVAPFLYERDEADPFLHQLDLGDEVYRKMLDSLRQVDSTLWKVEPLIFNDSIEQQNVTISDFKNWGGYKTILMETHGGLVGYGVLPALTPHYARWDSGSHIVLSTHVDVTNDTLHKYWNDMVGDAPRMLTSAKKFATLVLTESFFDLYSKDTRGTLISIGACEALANDNLWKAFRNHGNDSTAMVGFNGNVFIPFERKSITILYQNLIQGKTLGESYEAVKSYCSSDDALVPGTTGGRICNIINGLPCDAKKVCMVFRGDDQFTLKPRVGRVWHWGGGNRYSCAGTNPDTVKNIRNIKSVSGGYGHGLALEANGTVWGWGWNGAGQLGISPSRTNTGTGVPNVNYSSCTPIQVFPGVGYKSISAGGSRSLAVDSSGAVWRAGEYSDPSNDPRWIGDDGLGNSWLEAVVGVSPQRNVVSGLNHIVSVAAGNMQNLALDANGEVWAWGGNSSGELGLGDTLTRTTPTKIPGLVNITSISAGKGLSPLPEGSQSLALDRAGHVWSWGENGFGELGLSDSLDRNRPQLVPGLSKIKAISAGGAGCSAVDSSGQLWVWGLNDQGQLGLGDANNRRSPTKVPSMVNVSSVSHGLYPVLVDKTGKTFWSCGPACGNGFVQKKTNSFSPGSGVDQFGLTVAP